MQLQARPPLAAATDRTQASLYAQKEWSPSSLTPLKREQHVELCDWARHHLQCVILRFIN